MKYILFDVYEISKFPYDTCATWANKQYKIHVMCCALCLPHLAFQLLFSCYSFSPFCVLYAWYLYDPWEISL